MAFASPSLKPGHASGAGIGYLVAGITVFSIQDLILKLLSGAYPLYEIMIMRSVTAMPLLLGLVYMNGGLHKLVAQGWPQMLWRGFLASCAYFAYYLALASLPLATTAALFFTAPLFITLFSVVLLREAVGPRRWAAVAIGFLGALVMLRPGAETFDWAAVMAIGAGLTYAISMVQARQLGARHSAAALAFWGNLVFLACALVLAAVFHDGRYNGSAHASLGFLTRGSLSPTLHDLALMTATGVIAAAGLTLLTQAYRVAESNVIAPFEYTAMLWSVLFGWVFFHSLPDAQGWLGIVMIVGAGLYVLYREGLRRSR
ncbi:DMT family transporter [Albidovulum sp.]|uniref:DMT family transporter n=1 Tax=Albidovulum sp. TaxID=1872424 RepID=UPI001D30B119|nr:DMT family transporter [Paracoccaceae bacterium]MCB2140239.1 DMT family transporter [Paracoccaceae bacterium]MCB2141807.1 DMT family transporter [Paracoccaceae bacterium]MCB2152510.1 DMT family transporter [Paracoccaceae bacterium]